MTENKKNMHAGIIGLVSIAVIIVVAFALGLHKAVIRILATPLDEIQFWHLLLLLVVYIINTKNRS